MTKKTSIADSVLHTICKFRAVRTMLTKKSPFWFQNIYFADYLEYETAPFQYEMLDLMRRDDWNLLCIVAFRGSAKTTIMTTMHVLWSILGARQTKFALIISSNQSIGRLHMLNIRGVLENNQVLKNDLGPFREETNQWGGSTIVFSKYNARVSVVSVNESVRGIKHLQHRPDLVIIDDPEDLHSAKTRDGREKIYNWFKGEIIPIGSKKTRIVVLGNVVHEQCLVMRLKNEIATGTTSGIYKEYPLIGSAGNSMWPGKFLTELDLEIERKRIGSDKTWFREYLLKIIQDEDQVIMKDWIRTYDVPPPQTTAYKYRFSVNAVDLAVKDGESHDYTAIVSAHIYGYGRDMKIYILPHPINKKMLFPEIVRTIKDVSRRVGKGHFTRTYIEGNAAQSYSIQELRSHNFNAIEVISRGDKRERLSLISLSIQNGQILFPRQGCELLIDQLVNFGLEDHDDLSDALVMLVREVLKESSQYHPFPEQQLKKVEKGEDDEDDPPITRGLLKKRF